LALRFESGFTIAGVPLPPGTGPNLNRDNVLSSEGRPAHPGARLSGPTVTRVTATS